MDNFRGSSWPIKNNTTLKTNQNTICTEYVQIVYDIQLQNDYIQIVYGIQ